ncbi:MAG: serine/threonine protein kinase [Candidatus Obscuribacterales bacterium]|nr:serine/threonine protein kinase [Candidatus Obscuribacterales bacterium]
MIQSSADWFQRYRFCQPLGQGGMGVIYLAEDKSQGNNQCVVKQLISKPSNPDEQFEAERLFKREVEILRQLDHSGIVRFSDFHVTDDGKYFLVMDYVPGKNLDSIVQNYGPFGSEATVEIGIQCCEVLEYLHERDQPIIYRDLKPSNLMLTPEGQIVFIDFGIARMFMPKEAATRVVTAGYSPPEQYFGRPETRSDLYALGATLGHLCTGVRPKPLTVSAPGITHPDVIPELDDLIRRMTAHNPEDRPFSAREVRYELYKIYHGIHPDFEIPEEALVPMQAAVLPQKEGPPTNPNLRSGLHSDSSKRPANWLEREQPQDEDLQKVTRKDAERVIPSDAQQARRTSERLTRPDARDSNYRRRNAQTQQSSQSFWDRLKQFFSK